MDMEHGARALSIGMGSGEAVEREIVGLWPARSVVGLIGGWIKVAVVGSAHQSGVRDPSKISTSWDEEDLRGGRKTGASDTGKRCRGGGRKSTGSDR